MEAIREESLEKLGYHLEPKEQFSTLAVQGNKTEDNCIIDDLQAIFNNIEQSTMAWGLF